MDATMEALRLVSSEGYAVDRVSKGDVSAAAAAGGKAQPQQQSGGRATWFNGAPLPSKEVLITLLWVLRVEERRLQIREKTGTSWKLGRPVVPKTSAPTNNDRFILKVSPKRGWEGELHSLDGISLKRPRI